MLRNAERGESIDQMEIEYDGESVDVGFNVEYVNEFLKNMPSEMIEVHLKDEANQGLFKIIQDENDLDYRHVIMPMRLKS